MERGRDNSRYSSPRSSRASSRANSSPDESLYDEEGGDAFGLLDHTAKKVPEGQDGPETFIGFAYSRKGERKESEASDKKYFTDPEDIQDIDPDEVLREVNAELWDFFNANVLSQAEVKARDMMVNDIESIMKTKWPDAKCLIFGSYGTGLAYSEADVDISIIIKNTKGMSPASIIDRMETMLCKQPDKYGAVKSIQGAKVPIVKGIFLPCGTRFDISTSSDGDTLWAGIKYIRRAKEKYPLLHPLSVFIKQMLGRRRLDQPFTGGTGGYCIVLLLIAFFKSREICCPYISEDIEMMRDDPDTELAVALLDFFHLFGSTFNHRDVTVDVRNRSVFISKARMTCETSAGLSLIDPTSPTESMHDIGGAYFKWETVRDMFAWAETMLTLPYTKLMSTISCNTHPGETVLERITSTETLAKRIKELSERLVNGETEAKKGDLQPAKDTEGSQSQERKGDNPSPDRSKPVDTWDTYTGWDELDELDEGVSDVSDHRELTETPTRRHAGDSKVSDVD